MKKILLLGLAAIGLTFLWAGISSAQQGTQITVAPVSFEFNANPGETVSNQLKITNVSDSTVQLETRVENISGTGEQGQVQLTEEETKFSLSSWVQATPKQLTLAANETKTINFTVNVPANAEPGGHYGSILVGTIASAGPGQTGAAIAQRVGSLLLVRVSGTAEERIAIKAFGTKTFVGEIEETKSPDGEKIIFSVKDENLLEEKKQRYFQSGPVGFDLTFSNSGNVHARPIGYVAIYNIFRQKVAELNLDSRNVFPGNDRKITVVWPKKNLWGIYYTAELLATYGSSNQTLTAQASSWGFPLPVAIGIGVALLLFMLLRKRITRAFRILIKGS